jgi:ATP-dependent Clp protease ATP-binding subunit ClpA
MNVSVLIYIEEIRPAGAPASVHKVRPLFFSQPEERDENLNRAITKLARSLKREFEMLGARDNHQDLAAYTFSPGVEDHLLNLEIELGKRRVNCRLLVAVFESLGRKLAFTPLALGASFEIARQESLHARAQEVLTRHFRETEKRLGRELTAEEMSVQGRAWVTTLELDVHPRMGVGAAVDRRLAMLGGTNRLDGAAELRAVGRCLDWQYPDDLDRVICRGRELADLTKYLKGSDRRPVLLIGPRMAGKTALIHEYVYRRVEKKRSPYSEKRNVWLLSPQRLISGMIYVGQWEDRLLAILDRAKERDHVLYFDELLGLFHAGITRDSSLSAADVIKPYVEKREFRMLAEMTPEAYHVFQERDRGFADMFQLLWVNESNEDDTLRILMTVNRELERAHRCRFDFDVLAAVTDIQGRYVRDAAFPGKAALFLRQLAVKHRNGTVTRDHVLEEFHAKSGLAISFLNGRAKLERREVIDALSKEVIGQPSALGAAADVVCVAKARLNDLSRPLASFLFLGPTGVGKTQCAKSLAAYLFGDADRIIRFDMNEYVSAASVPRLAGTFDEPEGLLTSAVRRQPFSVVLLDEIEKADKDVFNLLLQVMGEGRLTDALGRTVDFTNTILILTSNLGVREASSHLGFREDQSGEGSPYVRAAEQFFKPEFFNRLDRVVPFERLRREDVQMIARGLIQGVFAREGLIRRRVVLRVDDVAMERIVDQGYHPTLGARALKRAIERQLTQPVASRLAAMKTETPTIVSVHAGGEDGHGIAVQVEGLIGASRENTIAILLGLNEPKSIVELVESAVSRIEDSASSLRPEGAIAPEEIRPEHQRYFAVKEQARRVRIIAERAARDLTKSGAAFSSRQRSRHIPAMQLTLRQAGSGDLWEALMAAENTQAYLRELAASTAPHGERVEDNLADLVREASLLQLFAQGGDRLSCNRVLVSIRSLDESKQDQRTVLAKLYEELFASQFGLAVTRLERPDAELLVISGPNALTLAAVEAGTHLFCPSHEGLVPIQVSVLPLKDDEHPAPAIEDNVVDVRRASTGDRITIRVYVEQGGTLDLRTGLMTLRNPAARELRAFVLSMLPLPEELLQ